MTFEDAKKFIMPFGKYKGIALDVIAESDDGLRYLDWLYGERASQDRNYNIDKALKAYLNDSSVQKDIASILDRG